MLLIGGERGGITVQKRRGDRMAESKSLLLKKDPCHCDNCEHFHESGCDCLVEPEINDLFGCLQYEPIVVVVPVVRCRKCKHCSVCRDSDDSKDAITGFYCYELNDSFDENFFCAYGERRTDAHMD